ncbi:MAG: hypothetical protein ACODAF_08705 [Actinomycetota bacterium]
MTDAKKEPAKKDPGARAVAEILAGRCDGHLGDIMDALQARITSGDGPKMYWRIRVGGDEWTEQSVTIGEVSLVERWCRVSWLHHNPVERADQLVAYITAHFHKAGGLDLDEAKRKAEAIPAFELAEAIGTYEADATPKDEGPSTTS